MQLTLKEIVSINGSLKNTPFKGVGVIDAAINLAKLSEPLKIVDSIKEQLLAKHNKGSNKFEKSDSPELVSFLEELEMALVKDVYVDGLKEIPIDLVDSSRASNQEAIAELIKHSIIKI